MPNIKSAIKRVETNKKKNAENRPILTAVKNSIKTINSYIDTNNIEEAEKYLHGEQIPHPCAKGWYAVMWHGHALGGAKSDGTYLKNKYPKQLRLR